MICGKISRRSAPKSRISVPPRALLRACSYIRSDALRGKESRMVKSVSLATGRSFPTVKAALDHFSEVLKKQPDKAPFAGADADDKIGRASCRERVCQEVSISVVAVALKQKKHQDDHATQVNNK